MRTALSIVMTFAMAIGLGCRYSPRGGGMSSDEGFTISVPAATTQLKQGDAKTIEVSLHRGSYFKHDVKLEVRPSSGIYVDPSEVTVRAGDKPKAEIRIEAPKAAALGEYKVEVKGIPETGETTKVDFTVKVVAP
jgi:uncharacterized membrane protein